MAEHTPTAPPRDRVAGVSIVDVAPPESPPAAPEKARAARHAVIYLPGLMAGEQETVEATAQRLALALDRDHEHGSPEFTATDAQTESFNGGMTTRVATVRCGEGEASRDCIDVFEFDYRPELTGRFTSLPPLAQVFQMLGVVLVGIVPMLIGLFRRSQSPLQKAQFLYGTLLTAAVVAYMAMLLPTAVAVIAREADGRSDTAVMRDSAPPAVRLAAADSAATGAASGQPGLNARQARPDPVPFGTFVARIWEGIKRIPAALSALPNALWVGIQTWPGELLAWVREAPGNVWAWLTRASATMQLVVVAVAVVGLGFRASIKDLLARVARETTCAGLYLMGDRKNRIAGHLSDLLNHIEVREKKEKITYDSVHLVGYSFGSVVAMDSVFHDSDVTRRMQRVDTLVTIGCPFDFVHTYWPSYFENRRLDALPKTWINVYSAEDVFASNFSTRAGFARVEQTGVQGFRGAPEKKPDAPVTCTPSEQVRFGSVPPSRWNPLALAGWVLTGRGFRAHSHYWEAGKGREITCYNQLAEKLFPAFLR